MKDLPVANDMGTGWWRIDAPNGRPSFTAGFLVGAHGNVEFTAPILAWMRGKTMTEVHRICQQKRWTLERI